MHALSAGRLFPPVPSRVVQEDRFVWADSGLDLSYVAWAPGQPDARYGGEDCMAAHVRMAGSSGSGLREVEGSEALWYDMGCSLALPFVCKREWWRCCGGHSRCTIGAPAACFVGGGRNVLAVLCGL